MKLPTSVTGISTTNRSGFLHRTISTRQAASRQGGFTLWELVIVVAIVAITVSMVQLSVGLGDDERELKRIGKDLGKLFHLLGQEAVFENRNYAISVQDGGYLVLEYADGNWSVVEDKFFQRFKMTENQRSQLIINDLVIDTSNSDSPRPHILILASGEMTPFKWEIRDNLTRSRIQLEGNVLGSVLMTGPEPQV